MADTLLAPTPTADAPAAPAPVRVRRRRPVVLTLRTVVVLYVALLVLVPVVALTWQTFADGTQDFLTAVDDPDTIAAFQLTALVAGISVVLDVVFGVAAAILLVRYRFPGRRLLSAFIDLPIAVSPIVVGLALRFVYGPDGWFGFLGDSVIFSTPGMVIATVFVSLPIVARAIVPVLEQAGLEQEQAAASLGAGAGQRFRRITLPTIRVALAYGTVLALARCIGEYGAVLVVSTHVAGLSETAPLRIGDLLDFTLDNEAQAYSIAFVLMVIAVVAIAAGALIRRGRKN